MDVAAFRTFNPLLLLELIVHSIPLFGLIPGGTVCFAKHEGSGDSEGFENAFRDA